MRKAAIMKGTMVDNQNIVYQVRTLLL